MDTSETLAADPVNGCIAHLESERARLAGPRGCLRVPPEDKVTLKLAMLYEGECTGLGAARAAAKFGYTRQGYYRIRQQFRERGATAFYQRSGPKTNYRRTEQLVRAVVRHRFQNPNASADEIAQFLRVSGLQASRRSVERIVTDYGLQRRSYPKARAKARRRSVRLASRPEPMPRLRPTNGSAAAGSLAFGKEQASAALAAA